MRRVLETMIEWGDRDDQGIVFYPRYFYRMDCAYQGLLRRSGLSQRELRSELGAFGDAAAGSNGAVSGAGHL
jgi:acyl-CoA thioesterase FadM